MNRSLIASLGDRNLLLDYIEGDLFIKMGKECDEHPDDCKAVFRALLYGVRIQVIENYLEGYDSHFNMSNILEYLQTHHPLVHEAFTYNNREAYDAYQKLIDHF